MQLNLNCSCSILLFFLLFVIISAFFDLGNTAGVIFLWFIITLTMNNFKLTVY